MQSGITASTELHTAFTTFLTTPTTFALLITISSELLTPLTTLTSPSPISSPTDFYTSLPLLHAHLSPKTPLYILLRRYPSSSPPDLVAVTYVPDTAPVRQKMLFASTRLTLLRELGKEKFRGSYFVTERRDLEREGWERWEAGEGEGELGGEGGKKPLTVEEEVLRGVKEDEEREGRGGTGKRRLVGGSGVKLGVKGDVMQMLRGLKRGEGANLVMLKIDVATETIELAGSGSADAAGLANEISDSEPRYSFFRSSEGGGEGQIIFVYTCPSGSKIKERMLYATSKLTFLQAVEDEVGLNVAKRLEASNPSEITAATIEEEFRPKQEQKQAFSRPKRPGKR